MLTSHFSTIKGIVAAGLAMLVLGIPGLATGQAWPAKPVTLIVPFPAGGATDTLTRVLAQELQNDLGQSFVVENKAGAAGAIGSAAVEKASPDGYTLLVGTSSTHSIAPELPQDLIYDAHGGFTPIGLLAESPSLLVIAPNLPFSTLKELIAYAKANPLKITYGSSGVGSIPHLSAAYFAGSAGIELQHIPYKGSSLAYPDLKSGRIDLMVDAIITALPQAQSGNVRALAVTTAKRSALAPDIPTIAESGVPGFQSLVWIGLFGPKKMAPDTRNAINAAVVRALQADEVQRRFLELGVEAKPTSPAEFEKSLARESEKWRSVIKEFNLGAK